MKDFIVADRSAYSNETFSSVSAILLSDAAMVSVFARVRVSAARLHHHTASCRPIEPVSRPLAGARSTGLVRFSAKRRSEPTCPENLFRIAQLLLHCCNTQPAIEAESHFRTRHRLYFAEQKIKIIS
jgi:hypothetical protein